MKNNHKNRLYKPISLILSISALLSHSRIHALSVSKSDIIKVYNRTGDPLYAGLYKSENQNLIIVDKVKEILETLSERFEKPSFQIYKPNKIVISTDKTLLKPSLSHNELKNLLVINTSSPFLSKFFITCEKNKLVSYSLFSWSIKRKKEQLQQNFLTSNNFCKNVAISRDSTEVSQVEQNFINHRLLKAQVALENIYSTKLTQKLTPKIAICTSGGGFRAMYSTIGLIEGLEQAELLDSLSYFSSASGSSWLLMSWLVSEKPIDEFKQMMIDNCDKPFVNFSKRARSAFSQEITKKVLYNQDVSPIDWYGTLLADKLLFTKHKFDLTLSDLLLKENLEKYPFPIFNAAFKGQDHYESLEITPYEIGSDYFQNYIPSWSLGRKFKNKYSKNIVPEFTLGYLMGILGSSFSASINDLIENVLLEDYKNIKEYRLYQIAEKFTKTSRTTNKKLFPARITNFSFQNTNSPIKDRKIIEVVDGGYACNIPLVPLLKKEREIDLIIILDNKLEQSPVCKNLKKANRLARRLKLPIPKIDFEKAAKDNFCVFEEEGCPTIIYIPLRKEEAYSDFDPVNAAFCSTYNFNYTEAEVKILSGLTKSKIINNKETILNLISDIIVKKHQTTRNQS